MASVLFRMIRRPDRVVRFFSRLRYLDYLGGTSCFQDAREVFRRWRAGEPLLDGPHIREFEQALGEYHGGVEAITFGAGRMALYAILKAMNLAPADEIILPGYACIVTPQAIQFAGGRPIYVDVSRTDFNIIPELVVKAITPRTRAILAQHTFGIPCDMDALLDVGRRFGIPIIDDGAHAIGARWDGRVVGRDAYAGFFSLEASKMFSTERGGYAVTADRALAGRIRAVQEEAVFRPQENERACLLRWCWRAACWSRPGLVPSVRLIEYIIRKCRVPVLKDILDYSLRDYCDALAGRRPSYYPSRLPNLMAYAGLRQLRQIEADLAHRRQLAAYLEEQLPPLGAAVAVYDHRRAQPSWVRFPLVVKDRVAWKEAMQRCGLESGYWLNDPLHPRGSAYAQAGYARGLCPNGEYLAEHVLNVPVHARVRLADLRKWVCFVQSKPVY